jgi:hypothetical protein
MTRPVEWLEPWYPVCDATVRAGLECQLRLEASRRHILFGESVRLIARRSDTDDALFELSGERVAEVHLTWRKSAEPDPRWPVTAIFSSLEEWVRGSMTPLHEELSTFANRRGG